MEKRTYLSQFWKNDYQTSGNTGHKANSIRKKFCDRKYAIKPRFNEIVGFSIVDLKDKNVWALFLRPEFEKQGFGRKLHDIMLNWYFEQTKTNIWLGTSPNTRAEIFYRKAGWTEIGTHGNGEIKFEMSYKNWKKHSRQH